MIEMELFELRIDDMSPEQIVVLREKEGNRILPIVIGIFEAYAIRHKIGDIYFPRPLTHDLMAGLLEAAQVKVEIPVNGVKQPANLRRIVDILRQAG